MHPHSGTARCRRLLRLAALALPLSLPACASGDTAADSTVAADVASAPATSPVAAREPCAILSAEDVSAAAGLGASTGKPSTSGGAQVCTWMDADGRAAIVQLYPSAASYEQSRTVFQSLYGGSTEELPDVADQAFFIAGTTAGMPTATVSVLSGQTAASVQVMALNGDAGKLRSDVVALTKQLLPKL